MCTNLIKLCSVVLEKILWFWDISYTTNEAHVDNMKAAQIEKDTSDVYKLKQYLDIQLPFPLTDKLLSINSGIIELKLIDTLLEKGE